jgi:hypothetical protein
MKDVTVPLLGEVFWIERLVARWERVEDYTQAFSPVFPKIVLLSPPRTSYLLRHFRLFYINNISSNKAAQKSIERESDLIVSHFSF